MAGAQIGLKDIHFAVLEKDTKEELKYETMIERLKGAIDVKVSPKASTEKLYSDDKLSVTATALGEVDVEINVEDLPLEVRAKWLGNKIENGIITEKASAIAPEIALGFKTEKSNGKYRYYWLTKGKAEPVDDEGKTKGDKIDFQTKKIKLTFMPREHDEAYRIIGDEDIEGFVGGDIWFTEGVLTGKIPVTPVVPEP